ncbi:MAG: lysophospholipid acyltransferase family protein [Spirochaetaceae bacterium]|nr:lysophospholipid acyltransferase family protein [Spirochaetaceae bacterium]
MKPAARWVAPFVRGVLGALCRVDASELAKVPRKGPFIIVMNHVNFLEAPLLFAHLYPAHITALAKKETWDNPVIGAMANIWECVPIDREGSDSQAMRLALAALDRGSILYITPEGTRSRHGRLLRGHAGVVPLALRSGAPLLPIALAGGQHFWPNLRRGRRTHVAFKVGEPFYVKAPPAGASKTARAEAIEEIMGRIADLLPPEQRGVYAGGRSSPRHLMPAEFK